MRPAQALGTATGPARTGRLRRLILNRSGTSSGWLAGLALICASGSEASAAAFSSRATSASAHSRFCSSNLRPVRPTAAFSASASRSAAVAAMSLRSEAISSSWLIPGWSLMCHSPKLPAPNSGPSCRSASRPCRTHGLMHPPDRHASRTETPLAHRYKRHSMCRGPRSHCRR